MIDRIGVRNRDSLFLRLFNFFIVVLSPDAIIRALVHIFAFFLFVTDLFANNMLCGAAYFCELFDVLETNVLFIADDSITY